MEVESEPVTTVLPCNSRGAESVLLYRVLVPLSFGKAGGAALGPLPTGVCDSSRGCSARVKGSIPNWF